MNFNLIPHDPEAYLIAADYQEEQGNLLTNAIRKKILPLDIENGDGEGLCNSYDGDIGFGYGHSYGNGHGNGEGLGDANNYSLNNGNSYGNGYGYGSGQGSGSIQTNGQGCPYKLDD